MATFLLGDQPPAAKVLSETSLEAMSPSARRGRQDYLNVCAGCHAPNGEGKPHIAVAMRGNTTLRPGRPAQPAAGDRGRHRRAEIHRV